ncbi:hypothetical protein D9613_008266 [Agrocybe pediades]|uniref:Uncharacterized protein n=1 Tax=Agrocybe pediades TaxID=84607 RepID=A0A8H4QT39_9AGAR|nr:hypothetical protein D9613_008266 [Agrocybe pediades]
MFEILPGVPLRFVSLQFSDENGPFPFPYIPPDHAFPAILHDAATSTSENSVTKTAAGIGELERVDKELKELQVSEVLFRNLVAYGDPTRKLPDTHFQHSTLDLTNGKKTEASGQAIARAVCSMQAEASAQRLRTCLSNCQYTTHIHAVSAMFPIANSAIEQRYFLDRDRHSGEPLPRESVPRWRGNTMRADARPIAGTTESPAGLADGILDTSEGPDIVTGRAKCNAVLHCKPEWAYRDQFLRNILTLKVLEDAQGRFDWNHKGTEGKLIRQLWGSMVTMSCNYALWSNGSKAFFAVRINEDRDCLVCTPAMDWSHHDTTRAVLGLTYAALDEEKWMARNKQLAEALAGVPVAEVPPGADADL